jgi:hypothetical protein
VMGVTMLPPAATFQVIVKETPTNLKTTISLIRK